MRRRRRLRRRGRRQQPLVALVEEPEHSKVEPRLAHVLEHSLVQCQPDEGVLRRLRVGFGPKLLALVGVDIALAPQADVVPCRPMGAAFGYGPQPGRRSGHAPEDALR